MIEVEEMMGPGFLMFFRVPGSPGGPVSGAATTSLFKSEYTLDPLDNEDDEILAIIMAFMFTKR